MMDGNKKKNIVLPEAIVLGNILSFLPQFQCKRVNRLTAFHLYPVCETCREKTTLTRMKLKLTQKKKIVQKLNRLVTFLSTESLYYTDPVICDDGDDDDGLVAYDQYDSYDQYDRYNSKSSFAWFEEEDSRDWEGEGDTRSRKKHGTYKKQCQRVHHSYRRTTEKTKAYHHEYHPYSNSEFTSSDSFTAKKKEANESLSHQLHSYQEQYKAYEQRIYEWNAQPNVMDYKCPKYYKKTP